MIPANAPDFRKKWQQPSQPQVAGEQKKMKSPAIVRWLFEAGRPEYWIGYGLLLVLTVSLFFVSKPPPISPLITSYLDLLDERSFWAIPQLLADMEAGSWTFLTSRAFVVALSFFLFATYLFCRGSYREPAREEGNILTRRFGLGNLANKTVGLWLVAAVYVVMIVSNYWLFEYYADHLAAPGDVLMQRSFVITYGVAIISRLFGVFIAIGSLVQLLLEDFGKPVADFFRIYRFYFYPAVLAIAIVAFVFTRMDQFDGLFIDLVRSPGNFLLFSIFLFPASIIIIWFTPSYLLFTDRQFANRVDSWDILHRLNDPSTKNKTAPGIYSWAFLHKRLFPQLDRLPARPPEPGFMPEATTTPKYPSDSFHRFRAFLGLAYIMILVGICAKVYFGNMREPHLSPGTISLIVWGLVAAYAVYAFNVNNKSRRRGERVVRDYTVNRPRGDFGWLAALRERPRMKRKGHRLYLKRKQAVIYVANRWPFLLGLGSFLLAGVLFAVTFYCTTQPDIGWERTFVWFLAFLINSVFFFTWLAIYQPFFYGHTFNRSFPPERFPSDNFLDRVDHLTTQAMLIINPLVAGAAVVFFVMGLLNETFVSSDWVAGLNPLNIYLLQINGFIAGLILLDRLILLNDRNKKYHAAINDTGGNRPTRQVATANVVWGMVIIAALLATTYLGNSYHEIQYHGYHGQRDEAPTLDEMVTRFLGDGTQQGPVIMVASDGGGLKACYWTMLNLLELDKRGLYNDNIFALSGASGGTIGLSMYNYLKARNVPTDTIGSYIERIGRRNFLSGDFAGLLTRFPLNYLPNLPGFEPHELDDRMEGMARAYFDIVGDGNDGYDYETIRNQPYWQPWLDAAGQNRKLPLLIANSARAEDGLLGTVIPLDKTPLTGTIDLTRDDEGKAISYPDATFLSNRFPLASPAARITGKGHFVDAGNADNSGINSLYSLLRTMKSRHLQELKRRERGIYSRLFERKVVILSLRNATSRYVRDEFLGALDSLNRYPYKSELSVVTGAAVNTGLSGVPISWDDYLRDTVVRNLELVDTFLTINLPFRLERGDIYSALGGELKVEGLDARREWLNGKIYDHLGPDYGLAVMPPLGRLLADPILKYMDKMVTFPPIVEVHETLLRRLNVPPDTVAITMGQSSAWEL